MRALAVLFAIVLAPGAAAWSGHVHVHVGDDHFVPPGNDAPGAFPSHAEVVAHVRGLADEPRVRVLDVGRSEEGREILLAVVADPPVASPRDVGDRVVTLLYTQQHGNEPAGTPAALAILDALAGPLGDEVLADQVVLVLPMVNPDGAEAGTRANVDGTDTNRDHMNLTSATARLLHEVTQAWRPVLAVDHHEYGGVGPGTGPVNFYDWDATILWPKHANVDAEVVALSRAVDEAMRARLEEAGYTTGDYGKLTVNGVPVADLAGGPTPDIARNHYGLHHTASLLVESLANAGALAGPREARDPEDRVAVHALTMEAAVRYVAEHADEARAVRDGAATRALARDLATDDGETFAFPKWGYRSDDAAALDTLARHGASVEGPLVPLAQPLRHHAGLLLDERSGWRIADGEAVDVAPVAAAVDAPAPVPLGGALATLAAVAVAVAVRRTR